ncbi:MAG: hypothetical protein ABI193_16780 [Minicystis sp.]
MDVSLALLLNLYAFSTGRRLFALQKTKEAAMAAGLGPLALHCDQGIAYDEGTRDLEARWAGDKDASLYAPEARPVDIQVDMALSALRDAINAEARDSDAGDGLAAAAQKLEALAFPEGLAAVVKSVYVDELSEVQRIIALLQSPDWAPLLPKLGLLRRLMRLVELEKKYAAVIALPAKTTSYDEVKAARAQGQTLMLQAVAMILGLYPSESDADVAGRRVLLDPILKQNEAIRVYLRERRNVEDVNPATGEVEKQATPLLPVTPPLPATPPGP